MILRSDASLRPSARKGVRGRLRHEQPAVIQAPHARPTKPYRYWEWSGPRRLRLTEHAGILIVTAPAWSLLDLGDTVTYAGELVARSRDIHRHGRAHLIGLAGTLRGGATNPHEFDIVGNDPLFHKRRGRSADRAAARGGRGSTASRAAVVPNQSDLDLVRRESVGSR